MSKRNSYIMRLDREFIAYMHYLKKALTTDIKEMSYVKISKKMSKILPPPEQFKEKFL